MVVAQRETHEVRPSSGAVSLTLLVAWLASGTARAARTASARDALAASEPELLGAASTGEPDTPRCTTRLRHWVRWTDAGHESQARRDPRARQSRHRHAMPSAQRGMVDLKKMWVPRRFVGPPATRHAAPCAVVLCGAARRVCSSARKLCDSRNREGSVSGAVARSRVAENVNRAVPRSGSK